MRDFAQVKGDGRITADVADASLTMEGVDTRGLDRLDRRFLQAIVEQYGGGPVGLEAIAATINDDAETLAELVEPYLLKIGLVVRTPERPPRDARRLPAPRPPGRRRPPPALPRVGPGRWRTSAGCW